MEEAGMRTVLLIHGYSSEGRSTSHSAMEKIYGDLPKRLRNMKGVGNIVELDLCRWISLEDGLTIDDISYAMQRALESDEFSHLLKRNKGFHAIIHSTGALVVRNWLRNHSERPSPLRHLIHLAGANFGSGLAHIGSGQLARWGREIFDGREAGIQVLRELEFGCGKTLDMHLQLMQADHHLFDVFKVREFCICGSQVPKSMRNLPIRYVKEDASDCTVRTSASNTNLRYFTVVPQKLAYRLSQKEVRDQFRRRQTGRSLGSLDYMIAGKSIPGAAGRPRVPFGIPFQTTHIGKKSGIVFGSDSWQYVEPFLKAALGTSETDMDDYENTAAKFASWTQETEKKANSLRDERSLLEWYPRRQYEAHAQLIFRLRDQDGRSIEHFDIFLKSVRTSGKRVSIEKCIEGDPHINRFDKGTIIYYLRTKEFKDGVLMDRLDDLADLDLEISAYEPGTKDIIYLPVAVHISGGDLRQFIEHHHTTLVDVTMLRIPSPNVFHITRDTRTKPD